MGKYIGKRILLLVPAVFLVCVIVFALVRLIPGDAVAQHYLQVQQHGHLRRPGRGGGYAGAGPAGSGTVFHLAERSAHQVIWGIPYLSMSLWPLSLVDNSR